MEFDVRNLLYLLAGVAVVVPVAVNLMVVVSVMGMRNGISLWRLDNISDLDPGAITGIQSVEQWASQNGFGLLGEYETQIQGLNWLLAVWKRQDAHTYVVLYQVKGREIIDIVSLFNRKQGLTTGSTKDAHMLPKPAGQYTQSLETKELDELYAFHAAGLAYLEREGGLRMQPFEVSFEALISEAIADQMAHVQSLPLWWARGVWWFFVRRGAYHNKELEQLHKEGKVVLPSEPGYRA